ncbi:MAG: hypothetical protein M1830_001640, partial [Pleopsidium flavum]
TWKWHHRLWLDFIENPSPPVLVVKWFSVALLGLAIYHSHQEDRYQNYFLLVGLGCATIVAHLLPQSPMTSLQTYLPFCVILALSLSALVHRIVRASTPNRSRGCYTGGKSKMRAERWFGARKDPSMRKEDMMV